MSIYYGSAFENGITTSEARRRLESSGIPGTIDMVKRRYRLVYSGKLRGSIVKIWVEKSPSLLTQNVQFSW